uniref:Uncharacterized protein n=1 Tax=Romanomermis culicivorax TaxID=13658 RepID=A0A915KLS3_ROMCU
MTKWQLHINQKSKNMNISNLSLHLASLAKEREAIPFDLEMLKSPIKEILFSWRSCIMLLCFLAFGLHTVMRNVINVSQICMLLRTNNSIISIENATISYNIILNNNTCLLDAEQLSVYSGNLPWTEKKMDYLIAILGWGRLLAVVPISLLAYRFDSAIVLFYAMLASSLSTFLFPVMALLYGYVPTLIL